MAYTPKPTRPVKMRPLNKAKRPNGRNYDRGVWTNNNGTEIARSQLEDEAPIAGKSTGDRAPLYDAFIAQRRKAKTKGY